MKPVLLLLPPKDCPLGASQDENGLPAAAQDEDDPTDAAHEENGPPAAAQDEDEQTE